MKIEAAGGSGSTLVSIRLYYVTSNKTVIFINVFVRTWRLIMQSTYWPKNKVLMTVLLKEPLRPFKDTVKVLSFQSSLITFREFPRLRPFVILWIASCRWVQIIGGMILIGENRSTRRKKKNVSLTLRPPQISHGLTCDRTRSSVVRGRRLTAWAIARPVID
jgi:hypothetical protein